MPLLSTTDSVVLRDYYSRLTDLDPFAGNTNVPSIWANGTLKHRLADDATSSSSSSKFYSTNRTSSYAYTQSNNINNAKIGRRSRLGDRFLNTNKSSSASINGNVMKLEVGEEWRNTERIKSSGETASFELGTMSQRKGNNLDNFTRINHHHHSYASSTSSSSNSIYCHNSPGMTSSPCQKYPLREHSPMEYTYRRPIFPKSKFLRKAQQLRKERSWSKDLEREVKRMKKIQLKREQEEEEEEYSSYDEEEEEDGRIKEEEVKVRVNRVEMNGGENDEEEEVEAGEETEDVTEEEEEETASYRSGSTIASSDRSRSISKCGSGRSVTMSPSVWLYLPMPSGLPPLQPFTFADHRHIQWKRSQENVSPVERLRVDEINFTFRVKGKTDTAVLANNNVVTGTNSATSCDKSPRWCGETNETQQIRNRKESPEKTTTAKIAATPQQNGGAATTHVNIKDIAATEEEKEEDKDGKEEPKVGDHQQNGYPPGMKPMAGSAQRHHQLINGMIIPQLIQSTNVPRAQFITASVSAIISGDKRVEELWEEEERRKEEEVGQREEHHRQHEREEERRIAGKLANMPKFHHPAGRPLNKTDNSQILTRIRELFDSRPRGQLYLDDFGEVCRRMGFAVYSKRAVFDACCQCNGLQLLPPLATASAEQVGMGDDGVTGGTPIDFNQFCVYWNRMISEAHDEASRFVFTLGASRNSQQTNQQRHIVRSDFVPMMMDLILTHPGLHFLKEAPQFYSRYADVVIVRIFWNVNRSWTGKITVNELRQSNFLQTLHMLEEEGGVQDINKVTEYFSYEHFYVTYCKFWELDSDHDMIISREDMSRHCNGALTDRIIERIFSAAVIRTPPEQRTALEPVGPIRQQPIETIGFEDFVCFLLAEEDKRHPTSIEYWFRCIDLDGDGQISLYEMEYFYEAIEQKLLGKNMETLALRDVICNLLDSISPANGHSVTRTDLKKSGLAHRFFNTFVNWIKYVDQESSDGERASVKTNEDKELSDWEMFCLSEYELLMSETEQMSNEGDVDENIDVILDDDEEESAENEKKMEQQIGGNGGAVTGGAETEDNTHSPTTKTRIVQRPM